MRFLKTLFWIMFAVLVTYFAAQNWRDVTIELWGNLEADVKIPVLVGIAFLIGFIPAWLIHRTRMWRLESRVPARQPAPALTTEDEPEQPE